jgi:hypothetical protein
MGDQVGDRQVARSSASEDDDDATADADPLLIFD